jgi:hyperosmotically inducible periplasmic protein
MLRALFKLILLVIIVVAVGGFFLGWWSGRDLPGQGGVGTAGRIDVERAKQAGEKIGDRTAEAARATAQDAKEALEDGALTAKIKAKMALDDTVKALDINVDTRDGAVTLRGTVRSSAERDRALQLARETVGVRRVVDQLTIEVKR